MQWFILASPIFIQIGLEAVRKLGYEQVQQEGAALGDMLWQGHLLTVIFKACLGLPWLCKVGSLDPRLSAVSSWLQDNPKERQQVVDAITSPRIRSLLWATLAAQVRCLHEDTGGGAMAFGCKVPSCNYRAAFDESDGQQWHWLTDFQGVTADNLIMEELLLVLSTSYLIPHAEEVLRLHLQSITEMKNRAGTCDLRSHSCSSCTKGTSSSTSVRAGSKNTSERPGRIPGSKISSGSSSTLGSCS